MHLIQLGNHWQPFIGLTRLRRALSLITTLACAVYAFSPTIFVRMGPLFHVLRAPVSGQVWVLVCLGRRGSCLVGCVRRFHPSSPPLVGFWPVVRPLFFSLAFSGFARYGPGVLVLVFSPFFFFLLLRSPCRVPVR